MHLPNRHHAERNVLRAHVVRALDLVDLVRLGHHDAVVLQHHGVRVHTDHALGVAVLAAHRQVESELVRVEHVVVARLGAAQRVDAAVERFVGAHLDGDAGVLAVDGNCGWRILLKNT